MPSPHALTELPSASLVARTALFQKKLELSEDLSPNTHAENRQHYSVGGIRSRLCSSLIARS